MNPQHEPRADDHHVEPLYAAVSQPTSKSRGTGPSLAVRLLLVALVAAGLLALVIKQAF